MTMTIQNLAEKVWTVVFIGLSLIFHSLIFGQESRPKAVTFETGFAVSITSVKDAQANAQGISTSGIGFQFGFNPHLYKILVMSLDGGIEFYKDKSSFTQATTGGTRKSGTTLLFIAAAVGLSTPKIHLDDKQQGLRITFGVNLGTDWVNGKRSIGDCTDCREEDLDLRGGVYVEPTLHLYISKNSGIGLHYRNYSNESDINQRLLLKYIHAL